MPGNAPPAGSPAGSNVTEFSVSEISGKLKRLVEDNFGRVRIRGEIAGYRGPHSSGHMYFALKDERARIEAVVWRTVAARLKHRPEEGLEVIATGKLTTYPGSSKYQIVIDQIEPAGAGALMALLQQRKEKLAAEGLFAAERKRRLPFMPKVVGIVTSPTGAVIRDILHRLTDRFPLHVMVWPVRVQGDTAAGEVANALAGFNAFNGAGPLPRPDILIVARGGGSIEDLWGFNEEEVVRAVAASAIPVIAAIGHETDWTLIDLVADQRAPTPTGAAEMAVPVKADLEARLAVIAARLLRGPTRNLDAARSSLKAAMRGLPAAESILDIPRRRLDEAGARLGRGLHVAVQSKRIDFEKPRSRLAPSLLRAPIERQRQRLGYSARNLAGAQRHRMEKLRQRYGEAARLLHSYSYQKTLERGFAVVRGDSGIVTRAAETRPGDAYAVRFADGEVAMTAAIGEGPPKARRPSIRDAGPAEKKSRKTENGSNKSGGKQGNLFAD